jgi:hypothetical protein
MGLFKKVNQKLITMGASPQDYKIMEKIVNGRTEFRIYYKNEYTGWASYNRRIADNKMKEMARNNR